MVTPRQYADMRKGYSCGELNKDSYIFLNMVSNTLTII